VKECVKGSVCCLSFYFSPSPVSSPTPSSFTPPMTHTFKRLVLNGGDGIEDGLDKVLGVVWLLEHSHLLAKPRGARLLVIKRGCGHSGDRHGDWMDGWMDGWMDRIGCSGER